MIFLFVIYLKQNFKKKYIEVLIFINRYTYNTLTLISYEKINIQQNFITNVSTLSAYVMNFIKHHKN